jgi:hypothetical protein
MIACCWTAYPAPAPSQLRFGREAGCVSLNKCLADSAARTLPRARLSSPAQLRRMLRSADSALRAAATARPSRAAEHRVQRQPTAPYRNPYLHIYNPPETRARTGRSGR